MKFPMKQFRAQSAAALWAAGLISLGLLCGCASRPITPHRQNSNVKPWIQDGQTVGTIREIKSSDGYNYQYKDLGFRLIRLEKRDEARQLLTGACTEIHDYDGANRLAAVRELDASEHPCLSDAGFSVRRYKYYLTADSKNAIEQTCFDTSGRPIACQAGWATLRQTFDSSGRIQEANFMGESQNPVGCFYLGVQGVADAQYSYLEGVGSVTCVALLDATDHVIARQQLSGQTDVSYTSYTSTYRGRTYQGSTVGSASPSTTQSKPVR